MSAARACALGLAAVAWLLSLPALAQSRSWAFVQSVGGLALGVPVERGGGWLLPVRCDVSGLRAVTSKPTAVDATLACTTAAEVERDAIVLTVMTHHEAGSAFAECPPVRLGKLRKGRYTVYYSGAASERVEIGEIHIPR